MSVRRAACAGGLLGALVAVDAGNAQSFCAYEITAVIEGPDCGILGTALVDLLSINDLGQACGSYELCATGEHRPFAWSEESGFVILPVPAGVTSGEAVSINNILGSDGLGQIACTLVGTEGHRAYFYDDGQWTLLPPEPGGLGSEALALNDFAEVVGARSWTSGGLHAFLWKNGLFTELAAPTNGLARDVNASSQVCGEILATDVGYLWDAGSVTEIPPLAGTDTSLALALNAYGLVTGASSIIVDGPDPSRAWRYFEGTQMQLPQPPQYNRASAIDVNDAGQILLSASTPPQPGIDTDVYLWQNGNMAEIIDLVELPPNVNFSGSIVRAINNKGQIGAVGSVVGGTNSGLILTPVGRPLGDVNIDCQVDASDLTMVLGEWGPCPAVGSCLSDIVSRSTFQPPGDGVVDAADLAVILGNWTVTSSGAASANRR